MSGNNRVMLSGDTIRNLALALNRAANDVFDAMDIPDNSMAHAYIAASLGMACNAAMLSVDDVTRASMHRLFLTYAAMPLFRPEAEHDPSVD